MAEDRRRSDKQSAPSAGPSYTTSTAAPNESLLDAAASQASVQEKVVLCQFKTSIKQRQALEDHVNTCANRSSIPIEWVIDIADESNGWFYGTAYDYNDKDQTLHVMVPDKDNPTFDGVIPIDYRSLHLIECVDGKTDALFNKIVRNSVQKIKWELEWFENDENPEATWLPSTARYYIQMTNQILVDDTSEASKDQGTRSYVLLTVDSNVKLLGCRSDKGQVDFDRLVLENIVLSTPDVVQEITDRLEADRRRLKAGKHGNGVGSSTPGASNTYDRDRERDRERERSRGDVDRRDGKPYVEEPEVVTSPLTKENIENLEMKSMSVRRIADYTKNLKDNIEDILEDREKNKTQLYKCARKFRAFALDGDLKQGLSLLEDFEKVKNPKQQALSREEEGDVNDACDAVKSRVGKIETGLHILMKAGGNVSSNLSEELDALKRAQRKLQKELDNRDKEISRLKTSLSAGN